MSSSQETPSRAKRTTRTRRAADRPKPQAPTNDTPTTVRSPRRDAHPLLALGFPGPKASATHDKSAEPSAPSATASAPLGERSGGGPPSSSSLGRELAALRAEVGELRGVVDLLREDIDELGERVCHSTKIERACVPVLDATRKRIATLGESLCAVEGRLARVAERSSSADQPAPVVLDLVSVGGEPSAAELEAVGGEWAIANAGAYLDAARKDLAVGKLPEAFAGIDAATGCNRMAAKYIEHVLTPFRLARGADPRNGQRLDGNGAAAIPLPPNPRLARLEAAKLSIEDVKNALELIVAVRVPLHDLWDAARDGSAPNGKRVYGRRERRQKVDDEAFKALDYVRCAELTIEAIYTAMRAAGGAS